MSAPIYDLLKRPDELFVVEHAHLQPRFVEDSVRHALRDALAALPQLDDGDFLLSKQVNFETIHTHDVVAERFGTVAELRGELETGRRARARPRSRTGSRVSYARPRPAQLEAVLGAAGEAGDVVAVEEDDRDRPGDRERDHRPARRRTAAREPTSDERGHDRRDRRVARRDEDHEPDREAAGRRERREREEGAAGRRDHLPALLEAQEDRPRVPEHRRGRREDAPRARRRARARAPRRRSPSRGRASATAIPSRVPYTRKTFVAPTFPLPRVRMSSPRSRSGSQ